MGIDIADARACQIGTCYKVENLDRLGDQGSRQFSSYRNDVIAVAHAAKGNLTEHERMHECQTFGQQVGEPIIPVMKMVDPDDGIDDDHSGFRK